MSTRVKEEQCSLLHDLGKNWLVAVVVMWIPEEGYWSVTGLERNKWIGSQVTRLGLKEAFLCLFFLLPSTWKLEISH